jgi:hypothetical protein
MTSERDAAAIRVGDLAVELQLAHSAVLAELERLGVFATDADARIPISLADRIRAAHAIRLPHRGRQSHDADQATTIRRTTGQTTSRRRTEPQRRRDHRYRRDPQPAELWWARIAFTENGTNRTKERPCVVVRVDGSLCHVVKATS